MHFLTRTKGCGRKNENDLPALALHPHRSMQHGQRLLFSRKGCAVPVAASSGDKSGGKGTASPLGMGIRGSRRLRREARTEATANARRVAAVTPAPIRPRRHAGRARPTAPPAPCRQKVLPPFCVATIRAGPRCRESNPGRGGPCASWRTAWLRRGAGASIISCNARRTQPSSANTNSSAPAPAPTEARAVDPDASKRTV